MNSDPTVFLSLAFFFGIAAQFRAAEGNQFLRAVISAFRRKVGALLAVALVATVFSPFVLNDVLILILTPVLIEYSQESGSDLAPLVVAEIALANIASSLTPFGNPQNILLWQATGASARQFIGWTWLPLLASAVLAVSVLAVFGQRGGRGGVDHPVVSKKGGVYLALAAGSVFVLDGVGVSSVVALGVAFAIGFAFTWREPSKLVHAYELRALLIIYALVGGVMLASLPFGQLLTPYVAPAGLGAQPYTVAFVTLVSNLVSNVPATQLILSTSYVSAHSAAVIAVDAGLAGNVGPIGSLANLLALLMVRRSGRPIRRIMLLQLLVGVVALLPAFVL